MSLGTAALTLCLLADREQQARRPVVIFAPATLCEQWQTEMLDKLGIPCARWDTVRKVWLDDQERAISPAGREHIARCPLRIGSVSTGLMITTAPDSIVLDLVPEDWTQFLHMHEVITASVNGLDVSLNATLTRNGDNIAVMPVEHVYPLVRSQKQLDRVLAEIEDEPGIVLFTLLERDLVTRLEGKCQERNIPSISIIGPGCNCSRPISARNRPRALAPSTC